MKLIYWLLGGRPMRMIKYAFADCLTGEPVYYREDKHGRIWMAIGRWSMFRARAPIGTEREIRKELECVAVVRPEEVTYEEVPSYSEDSRSRSNHGKYIH